MRIFSAPNQVSLSLLLSPLAAIFLISRVCDRCSCVRIGGKAETADSLFAIHAPFTPYSAEPKESLEIVPKEVSEILGPISVADQGVMGNPESNFAVTTVECYL